MLRTLLKPIKILFEIIWGKPQKIQTFTYFIPSPPRRDTGYREKQFDKEFYEFINKGYEIISINTQQSADNNKSGMWFICTVRAKNSKAAELNFSDEFGHDYTDPHFQDSIVHEHELDNYDDQDFTMK